jgi:hypothetical protein
MARHHAAHARSGLGRYTPPGRIRPAHAAAPVPSHLARRAGVLLGTGVLASAGLLGLSVGSAGASDATAPPTTCPPTAGTVDLDGNSACAIGTSGAVAASAAEDSTGGDHNNSALATVIGSLGGSATAASADLANHSDRNVAIAVSAGGITGVFPVIGAFTLGTVAAEVANGAPPTMIAGPDFGDDSYRDSAVAVGNGDILSLALAGNVSGLNAANTATASAGYLSVAVAAAANFGDDNFRNAATAIAQLGGQAYANAAGSVIDNLLGGVGGFATFVIDSTGNTAFAAASLGGIATANAGTGGTGICTDATVGVCVRDQHNQLAEATANLGTATATAGGAKSFQYNNTAQAGVLLGGTATATAGDCTTSHCGGSNNEATASASYGGSATADVSGDTTGYAVANSAGTVTSDTETDTSSVLSSTSPDAGGMGFAYDADGNWVASLNFNGTDKVFSNVGNG